MAGGRQVGYSQSVTEDLNQGYRETNLARGRVEAFNSGLSDYNTSALNYTATLPTDQYCNKSRVRQNPVRAWFFSIYFSQLPRSCGHKWDVSMPLSIFKFVTMVEELKRKMEYHEWRAIRRENSGLSTVTGSIILKITMFSFKSQSCDSCIRTKFISSSTNVRSRVFVGEVFNA